MSDKTPATRGDLKGFLEKNINAIEAVASATLTPERMVRLVCAAASRDPQLAKCTPLSILRSLAQAASMGLEPFDGRNEVHLVPRWNKKANGLEATCLVGYPGLIRLATETGKVRNVEARVVYQQDVFSVDYGISPKIEHHPSFARDRGPIIAVYAVAFLPDGGVQFEVMAAHEVEDIRDRSKDKDVFSPWKSDFAEMARKTAVRRLCKYLPKSTPLAKALEIQAKAEAGEYIEHEAEAEVLRPGDANVLQPPTTDLDGDGNVVHIWTDEDNADFFTSCDVLLELASKAGYNEAEIDAKIDLYRAQKNSGLSADVVLRRMGAACQRYQTEFKQTGVS